MRFSLGQYADPVDLGARRTEVHGGPQPRVLIGELGHQVLSLLEGRCFRVAAPGPGVGFLLFEEVGELLA